MLGFLSGLDAESQKRIIENWAKMQKKHKEEEAKRKEEEAKQKEKEEAKQKEEEEKQKLFKFIRENPPKSFKDIMMYGNFISKYGNPYQTH